VRCLSPDQSRHVNARSRLEGHGVSLVADRYRDSAGVQIRRHPLRHAGQVAEYWPELFGALHCLVAVSLALRPPGLTPAAFLAASAPQVDHWRRMPRRRLEEKNRLA
jgi:hypothetical protein